MELVLTWLKHTWMLVCEASPFLLLGLCIAGLLKSLLPEALVKAWLGSQGFITILKASLIGTPLPLCSCGVLPVAKSLQAQGAGRSATMTFLIATPENGVDSIAMSVALLGGPLAMIRLSFGWICSILVGVVDLLLGDKGQVSLPHKHECCEHTTCSSKDSQRSSLSEGIRYAFGPLLKEMSAAMWIGFVLAGVLSVALPHGFLGPWFSGGLMGMLLVLTLSIPLYVCAAGSTPVALSLMQAGMSPGTAMVFLLAGPAVNTASLTVLTQMFGIKAVIRYVLTLGISAIGLGVLLDTSQLWIPLTLPVSSAEHVHAQISLLSQFCAIMLLFLSLRSCIGRTKIID